MLPRGYVRAVSLDLSEGYLQAVQLVLPPCSDRRREVSTATPARRRAATPPAYC